MQNPVMQSIKLLKIKCRKSGEDFCVVLLDLRNILRDNNIDHPYMGCWADVQKRVSQPLKPCCNQH